MKSQAKELIEAYKKIKQNAEKIVETYREARNKFCHMKGYYYHSYKTVRHVIGSYLEE